MAAREARIRAALRVVGLGQVMVAVPLEEVGQVLPLEAAELVLPLEEVGRVLPLEMAGLVLPLEVAGLVLPLGAAGPVGRTREAELDILLLGTRTRMPPVGTPRAHTRHLLGMSSLVPEIPHTDGPVLYPPVLWVSTPQATSWKAGL